MGWLSKAWKGVKKAVKKVARTVKKVAKKVAYAVPGGKQLWKLGTKVGQGITKGVKKLGKGIMKGISKLGPVGIMAAQVVLSATGIGAGLAAGMSAMWSGFGATAAAAAQAGSVLGAVGNAVYTGVNWAAGSLGAIGNAFSEGASQLMSGNFSQAASQFGTNMSQALTGEAGMTAVREGVVNAATSAAQSAAGQSLWSQATSAASDALATSGGLLSGSGKTFAEQGLSVTGEPLSAPVDAFSTPEWTDPTLPDVPQGMQADRAYSSLNPVEHATPEAPAIPTAADAVKPEAGYFDNVSQSTMDTVKDVAKTGVKSLLSSNNDSYAGGAAYQPTEVGAITPTGQHSAAYMSEAQKAALVRYDGVPMYQSSYFTQTA